MRRLIVVILSLCVACAGAIIFLPMAGLFDPTIRSATGEIFFRLLDRLVSYDGSPEEPIVALAGLTSIIFLAICVVPVVIVALIGELGRVSSILWYVGGTAILAAAMPWILRAAKGSGTQASAAMGATEQRMMLLFFLTGAVAGFIYWLLAARSIARAPLR